MPFIAQDLIDGKAKPITVNPNDPAQKALEQMVENNFSQLPVVDEQFRPLGLVTSDSILLGMANLGLSIEELKINDVIEKIVPYYSTDDPIFELLKGLNVASAVLIIDQEKRLIGIITNWDTAEYFRKRASDMMLLEDVETLLKDHIRAAFTNQDTGEIEEENLRKTISEISNPVDQKRKDIKISLKQYINLVPLDHTINELHLEKAFSKIIGQTLETKSLEDLSMYEFVELLFHKSSWNNYGSHFDIPKEKLRSMLDEVRKSRNALAHFKREISALERQRIRSCIKFLQETHPPRTPKMVTQPSAITIKDDIIPLDEEFVSTDSIYAPLSLYLQRQPIRSNRIEITFNEIEKILERKLPDSAREHRSWWANDSVGHVQSKQWLEAGWRVASINMTSGVITFSRNAEREHDYINFFSALLEELRKKDHSKSYKSTPTGTHWLSIMALPHNKRKLAWLNISFTRQKQIRVELYIDTTDQRRNKAIFDKIYQHRSNIEAAIDTPISWERLDLRRACRIAIYRDGFITDSEDTLKTIRSWAAETMIRFEKAIVNPFEEAIKIIAE